jgi:hypothetical protein
MGLITSGIINLIFATTTAFSPYITFTELEQSKPKRIVVAIVTVCVTLLCSFTVGYDRSRSILLSEKPTETITVDDKGIPARLIRGGERGILFLSLETKKVRFMRWDSIKQIESL